MSKTLFITGATGFIGTHLLGRLNLNDYRHIYCLGRKETDAIKKLSKNDNFTFLKADIFETALYSNGLNSSDTVIHIAAITGKAKPHEYFRVNSSGTFALLEQCKKTKINQFIFISSIAVNFRDIKYYYYGQSKIEAEDILRTSGIPYTIIRPTIVIGENAPILNSLLLLAKIPAVPIFGDGSARIQPVYVGDLVVFILNVIKDNRLINEAVDFGGPERISMKEFIHKIHRLSYNKKFRSIHLPVWPIKIALNTLEKFILPLLPFTAGQLASFTNSGVTGECLDQGVQGIRFKTVDEMLAISLPQKSVEKKAFESLEEECRLFTNYLIDQEPSSHIYEKYWKGHISAGLDNDSDLFDSFLVKLAGLNSFFIKLCDVYTTIFHRNALLKKKLILLLAILECYATTYQRIEFIDESSWILLYLKIGQKTVVFSLMLLFSLLLLSPIHLSLLIYNRFITAFAKLWKK